MTFHEGLAQAGRKSKDYEIVVNGTPVRVEEDEVSYEEIVQLAFPCAGGSDVIYSVAYAKAEGGRGGSGMLVAGGTVKVTQKGTSFRVTATTRS